MQKVPFCDEDCVYQTMLSTNKVVYVEGTFCYRNYMFEVSKLQHVCNRFNTSFCVKDHKTNQAILNLNGKF